MGKVSKFVRLRRCLPNSSKVTDFFVRASSVDAAFRGAENDSTGILLNSDSGKAFVLDGFMESPATVARRVQAAEGEDG